MTDELKPCPFCGEQEFISVRNGMNAVAAWVICNNCGCYGPTEDTKAEAITAWNRREGGQDG